MTYEETVLRLVRLMYVAHEERWVDLSLRNLTGDWLRRVEERFAGVNNGAKASTLTRGDYKTQHGSWATPPPKTIATGGSGVFKVDPAGSMSLYRLLARRR